MIIQRAIFAQIKQAIKDGGKVIIIYGPRQSGKTTLIGLLSENIGGRIQKYIGDDLFAQNLFSRNELSALKKIIGDCRLLIIDEAQRIENIGLSLKLMIDNLPLTIVVSGSSSFDLANKVDEPLTGRTKTFWLYPFAYKEIAEQYKNVSADLAIAEMLRFGMFPAVYNLTTEVEKENYLTEYISKYLYRDILSFENVRKPKKIIDLLSLLALQIGNEVSVAELAKNLKISQKTVESYLDVLEKMFIIINLRGFSRNLRKEIAKTSKYYFTDVGIRNALIRNFNSLELRNDVGALFENWFIMEKIKTAGGLSGRSNFYFWRTYDQYEIDLIEESAGRLIGYECKWSENKKSMAPKDWLKTYKNGSWVLINRENFSNFLV